MVTGLTNANIRFSVRAAGVNVGSAVIPPLLLKGQLVNVEDPTLERDTINYTGSGVTTEIIETVLQPMQVTYTLAGWDDRLLELLEMPLAVMEVERWLRAKDGVLETTGKRIQANWEVASGNQAGFHYRRTRYTAGRFRDPRGEAGEQGTATRQSDHDPAGHPLGTVQYRGGSVPLHRRTDWREPDRGGQYQVNTNGYGQGGPDCLGVAGVHLPHRPEANMSLYVIMNSDSREGVIHQDSRPASSAGSTTLCRLPGTLSCTSSRETSMTRWSIRTAR